MFVSLRQIVIVLAARGACKHDGLKSGTNFLDPLSNPSFSVGSCTPARHPFSASPLSFSLAFLSHHPLFRKQLSGSGSGTVDAIMTHALQRGFARSLSGRRCARLLWALGRVAVHRDDVVDALGPRLCDAEVLQQLTAQEISMAVWGLAKVRWCVLPMVGSCVSLALAPGYPQPLPQPCA